jgi:hypothetical protein
MNNTNIVKGKSMKGKSMKGKSMKGKSMKGKSMKGKSIKRKNKSIKKSNKTMKRKSMKKGKKNMKQKGGMVDIHVCDGKRDGVSGCRDCCSKHFDENKNYSPCIDSCMKY